MPQTLVEQFTREFSRRGFYCKQSTRTDAQRIYSRLLANRLNREFYSRWGDVARYAGRWEETKHPRADDGKFGQGGGAAAATQQPQAPAQKPAAAKAPPAAKQPAAQPQYTPKPPAKPTGVSPVAGAAAKPTPPPPPQAAAYRPFVEADQNGDGITDAARVGVGAFDVPPPPGVGRLPNLNRRERGVENAFIKAFAKNPDGMASQYRQIALDIAKAKGEPPTFETDAAKGLTKAWTHPDQNKRSQNRATLNTALHQTANAVAKRAFVQHMDSLKPGDRICVTCGGCGSGKGFALKNVPEALQLKMGSKAVWDSAGDQNATENPWVQAEAEKRGLKVDYVYCHANPESQWADPDMGVVKRAADPNDGRMIDAAVYADSYALGAKNHQKFYDQQKANPNANFVFLQNGGKAGGLKKLDGIPPEALKIDRAKLRTFAANTVRKSNAPRHVKVGALRGMDLWR